MAVQEAELARAGNEPPASVERATKRLKSAANDDVGADGACANDGASDADRPHFVPGIVVANRDNADDGAAGDDDASLSPNLSTMPPKVLTHIVRRLPFGTHLDALLTLEKTCKSLRDTVMDNDEIWGESFPGVKGKVAYEFPTTVRERLLLFRALRGIRSCQRNSSEDIILDAMGGADGVRRVVGELLTRMRPDVGIIGKEPKFTAVLRGDALAYLTEVIQAHVTVRLGKAHRIVLNKLRSGDAYPMILPADLQFLDELMYEEYCSVAKGSHGKCLAKSMGWAWPADDCKGDEVLGTKERFAMAKKLSYRAGVAKMSGEAYSLVAAEVLHYMGAMVAHAFEACKNEFGLQEMKSDDPRYVTPNEDDADGVGYGNYFAKYCPPFQKDEDGRVKCVIIPRQIEDAAVKSGMKPLLGFDHDFSFWAASDEDKREEEVEEAKAQYFKDANPREAAEGKAESGQVAVVSARRDEIETAAASGDYIKAGFIQAEAKMTAQVDGAIVLFQTQMKAAAAKEDFVEAGKKQQIVRSLERNRESLRALEKSMFEAAVQQDFVLAGRIQQQHADLMLNTAGVRLTLDWRMQN